MKQNKLYITTFLTFAILCSCKDEIKNTNESDIFGLKCISDTRYPVTENSVLLNFPNGDMKNVKNNWSAEWLVPNGNKTAEAMTAYIYYNQKIPKPAELAYAMGITLGEYDYICSKTKNDLLSAPWDDLSEHHEKVTFVEDKTAPENLPYIHMKAGDNSLLRSPGFEVKGGKPHFMTMWVKSRINNEHNTEFYIWYDTGLEEIRISRHELPGTKGQWKRYGFYFRALSDTEKAHFTVYHPGNEDEYLDMGGFDLREVSETEYSAAYAAERKKLPGHTIRETPDDGKYLATSIAKLDGKLGIPGKPFVIWTVGASWTSELNDLEPVKQTILSRFPNAPEIIFRKKTGSGSPYDYIRGWVHTGIMAAQPDLIISYTNGSPDALEKMLKDIRQHSTADIIIPSLHFFKNESGRLTPEVINNPVFDEIKNICEKYNAQFVDNRRAIAAWLATNDIEVKDLLRDEVHNNDLGRLITCENIGQQFVRNTSPAYDPYKEEENIMLVDGLKNKDPRLIVSDGWTISGNKLISKKAGNTIKIKFEGNRIDLIGHKNSNGGNTELFVDGAPAKEAPAYYISFITSAITNIDHMGRYPRSSKGNADSGPHGVYLDKKVTPQQWTIRMTDDSGNYELEGSVTGKDGSGNNSSIFTGKSGQITIDPATWRAPNVCVKDDNWTFEVARCAVDTVKFTPAENDKEGLFSLPLVQNLTNEEHTIELKTLNDNEVAIESFYVFTPQLK